MPTGHHAPSQAAPEAREEAGVRTLAGLRAQIAAIENRPVLEASPRRTLGEDPFATPPGLLHEIFSPAQRDAGAGLGFALALARALIRPGRPAVFFIQLGREAQELGLPFGGGLAAFGFAPESLVLVQAATMVEFLWAMEEALLCRAVAAVIGEVGRAPKLLDFTASRRLSLRAAEAGTSPFLLRYGTGREASAATLRWRVEPRSSAAPAFDPRAPGEARWRVHLEKGFGQIGQREWLVGWTENGLVAVEHGTSPPPERAPAPALSRPPSPALGHRLAETA